MPRVEAVELRRLRLPLRSPFRAAHGTQSAKDVLVVRVVGPGSDGWGECAALAEPTYTSEYLEGAYQVLRDHLVPRALAAGEVAGGEVADVDLARALAPVRGHLMAKAALEMAVLDAELRDRGVSLATFLGGTRSLVDAGVALGLAGSVGELVATAEAFVAQGYRRVKLKIEPGWDVEPVAAVRAALGPEVAVLVDANGTYAGPGAGAALAELDDCGLDLFEQPLAPRDLKGHAELARRLHTPICLDESIESVADAELALDLGACSVVNIKPGRCGGLLEAVAVHDLCLERRVPVWCGGMLETGLGRAANVALASLAGFTLPGDLSASDRYFDEDLTEPFLLEEGSLRVPVGPGLGVAPRPEALERFTTSAELIR